MRNAAPSAGWLAVRLLACAGCCLSTSVRAQAVVAWDEARDVREHAASVQPQVVAWRRDIHSHPELSNRETRTAALVARELRALGIEVHTGIAHTGVVGILRGEAPGRTVALRADMDALPVEEKTGLPFASAVPAGYQGQSMPVMHACGHDAHVAMLLGAAKVLSTLREHLHGTVLFVFQPAEEGPPEGEEGGARLMLASGGLGDPLPDAIFGIHVWPGVSGHLYYRDGGAMAGSDAFAVTVKGRQAHGGMPWKGVDPVSTSAAIIQGLNTVVSRQLDMSLAPTVVTIGSIHGGTRGNIVPEQVQLVGTIRTLDPNNRQQVLQRVKRTAEDTAAGAGATAEVAFGMSNPITWNPPSLVESTLLSLRKAAGGAQMVEQAPVIMASEDFSAYQQKMPGFFYFLGITKDGADPAGSPPNHSPYFDVDESAMEVGVRAHVFTALDFLAATTGAVP